MHASFMSACSLVVNLPARTSAAGLLSASRNMHTYTRTLSLLCLLHASVHVPACSLVNLPAGTGAADLLSASGKKSMLKEGAAWKTGPVRTCEARHMDEAKLKLSMQVRCSWR